MKKKVGLQEIEAKESFTKDILDKISKDGKTETASVTLVPLSR